MTRGYATLAILLVIHPEVDRNVRDAVAGTATEVATQLMVQHVAAVC